MRPDKPMKLTAVTVAVILSASCGAVPRQVCGTIEEPIVRVQDSYCSWAPGDEPEGAEYRWYVAHPEEEVDFTDLTDIGEPLDDDYFGEVDHEEPEVVAPRTTTKKPKPTTTRPTTRRPS